MSNIIKTQQSKTSVALFETPSEEYIKLSTENAKKEVGEEIIMTLEGKMDPKIFQQIFSPTIYLHVKWHYNCYYFYAEYYYEAWTTSTADPNGPRVVVDTLELFWKHGGTHDHIVENNVTMVSKTDKTYNLGCDDAMCVKGVLRHYGQTVVAMSPDNCVPI